MKELNLRISFEHQGKHYDSGMLKINYVKGENFNCLNSCARRGLELLGLYDIPTESVESRLIRREFTHRIGDTEWYFALYEYNDNICLCDISMTLFNRDEDKKCVLWPDDGLRNMEVSCNRVIYISVENNCSFTVV